MINKFTSAFFLSVILCFYYDSVWAQEPHPDQSYLKAIQGIQSKPAEPITFGPDVESLNLQNQNLSELPAEVFQCLNLVSVDQSFQILEMLLKNFKRTLLNYSAELVYLFFGLSKPQIIPY